jgi:ComEC/Rec2-related protein
MKRPVMPPRLPLVLPALAAVLGVFLADQLSWSALGWSAGFFVLAIFAIVWPGKWVAAGCSLAAFAALHALNPSRTAARDLEKVIVNGPRVVVAEGMVSDQPQPLGYASRQNSGVFRLRLHRLSVDGESRVSDARLSVLWSGPLPAYGDLVSIRGSLRPIEAPRNPGQLDFGHFLRRQGVAGRLKAAFPEDCRVVASGGGNPIVASALRSRSWMQRQLAIDLEDSPEIAGLVASMVLGARSDTPEEVKDLFRRTGTLHLFAVSGLNVAMLAMIAGYLLKVLGCRRRLVAFAIIPVLIFYAVITGLSASCVRATMMGALVLVATLIERPALVYNCLAAAAVGILAYDTNELFSPGFQFSFVLVFAIVLCADRISRRFMPLYRPDRFLPEALWNWRQRAMAVVGKLFAASIGVTLAAWLGSLIFSAGYFHLFSPIALAANLVAVPLAFCVLALGLATVLTAPLLKPVAVLFSNANWFCVKLLLGSVEYFAALPGGHIYVEMPRVDRPPACEITVLDVGEGAAIHLRSGAVDWLIDAGPQSRYDNIVLPYLRSRGIDWLDALVCTHGDAQHIGAALAVCEDFAPRVMIDSPLKDRSPTRRKWHAAIAENRRGKTFARMGDAWSAGAARVSVLYPPANLRRAVADDQALVLAVECEGRRVLLMSDAGFVTERWLLESGANLRADLVVKGHHRDDLSGTLDFLTASGPQALVASALGYGETADALDPWASEVEALGIRVFRQDRCGAVSIRIRNGEIEARGFLGDQSFRSRAR